MSWGVSFNTDIFLSRQDYQENIGLVQDKIDELSKSIEDYRTRIMMYASANPKDVVAKEWEEEPINWLKNQLDELFVMYEEDITLYVNLMHYKEYLENKNNPEIVDKL